MRGWALWGVPVAFVAALGLLRLVRARWLRDDLAPRGLGAALGASERRIALRLFLVALAFQLVRWLVDGGAVGARPGGDDEGYVFLAQQVLGDVDPAPAWAYRAPGWPLTIAGLLALFGRDAVWTVGLYHRVLLAAWPPALYLVLARFVCGRVAVGASLLSLALPHGEQIARTALADLTYSSAALFAVAAAVAGVAGRGSLTWLAVAGVAGAWATLIRVTGLGPALALAFAAVLAGGGSRGWRWRRGLLVGGPAVVAVLLLSAYNAAMAGHFRPGSGGSIAFLDAWASYFPRTPDTPAVREIAGLVPEVPPEHLFHTWRSARLAQYRFVSAGRGDVFEYGALADRAAREIVAAEPAQYLALLARAALVTVWHPFDGVLPAAWRNAPVPLPVEPVFASPVPGCALEWTFGPAPRAEWCARSEGLRGRLAFAPPWLGPLPELARAPAAWVTRTLPNRARLWLAPFWWGAAALAGLIALVASPGTRGLGLLVALPLAAELASSTLILADNSAGARYMLYVYPACWISVWLGAAVVLGASRGAPRDA